MKNSMSFLLQYFDTKFVIFHHNSCSRYGILFKTYTFSNIYKIGLICKKFVISNLEALQIKSFSICQTFLIKSVNSFKKNCENYRELTQKKYHHWHILLTQVGWQGHLVVKSYKHLRSLCFHLFLNLLYKNFHISLCAFVGFDPKVTACSYIYTFVSKAVSILYRKVFVIKGDMNHNTSYFTQLSKAATLDMDYLKRFWNISLLKMTVTYKSE